MADLNVELDEQTQKATNDIQRCHMARERIYVAAVVCEYKMHKNRVYQ